MDIRKRSFNMIYIIIIMVPILLTGCKQVTMKNLDKQPSFIGLIEEVHERSILVRVSETENIGSDLVSVSLNVKLKDSETEFEVGNQVEVYYDGNIAESYPAQVHHVYAVVLMDKDVSDPPEDLQPSQIESVNEFQGVIMSVKEDSISPKGLTLTFENKSVDQPIYGEYFLLEQRFNGKWYEVPVTIEGNYGFNDIGYTVGKGQSTDHEVDWEWLYGSLEAGDYRIIKDVLDFEKPGHYLQYHLAVEFKID